MPDGRGHVQYPSVFEPVLEKLAKDAPRFYATPSVDLLPETYEDRPYSHLLLAGVRPAGSAATTAHLFVKISKLPSRDVVEQMRRRIQRDFETTAAIYDHLAAWDSFGAVRPVVCYAEHFAIVTERARGETLLDHLHGRSQWFPNAAGHAAVLATLENVGRWIKAFQTFRPGSTVVSTQDLREYVDLRLRRLVERGAFTQENRTRVLDRLGVLASTIRPEELREVAIHADLAPSNVLVDGPRVVALDFAMATRGHFLHDVSRLSLQIDLLKAKLYRHDIVDAWQSALLRGLDASVTARHPLFRFSTILHRINHLGTLTVRPEGLPGILLSRYVRRLHRQWLERELNTPPTGRAR